MADQTYSELTVATDIQTSDLMATFRPTSGPLKSVTWFLVLSTIETALASLFLAKSQNLADLPNESQARSNLGLGTAAVANIGTNSGTAAAGDDSRFAANATAASNAQTTANGAATTANAALPAARITYGTASPGALATGVFYFQYTP